MDDLQPTTLSRATKTHPTGAIRLLRLAIVVCGVLAPSVTLIAAAPLKPRMVALTDISPDNVEPDDMQSIIRLFVHADLFEIEGLVATTGWSNSGNKPEWVNLIHETIDLYEKDLPNLRERSEQKNHLADETRQAIGYWPSPDYLRSVTVVGSQKRGMSFIGEENQTTGSDLLIKLADEPDDRPIWVTVWGGGNTLAQAIWQVQQTRGPEQLKAFLRKLRVYTITDQDGAQKRGNVIDWPESSHLWMRREFEKDLFFIWDESAWKHQNGTGRSNWDAYAAHVQQHGNLGGRYPKYKYGVEGDTPAFLHIIPTGLNNPNVPNQVGWGGYFELGECKDGATKAYQNHGGSAGETSSKYQRYFYPATFNNFAARMDWAKNGKGNRNPVVVIGDEAGLEILAQKPRAGTSITLDASKSHDPDGDKLTFKWWVLPEAGTCKDEVVISGADSRRVTIQVPPGAAGTSIHVICEVTDDGTHNLTGYRRIILEPTGPAKGVQPPKSSAAIKPRVIVLSDFPPLDVIPGGAGHGPAEKRSDPDDVQSMVRFLVYANEFDVEGLVASSGTFANIARKQHILDILDLYDQVDENLRKHDSRYPTADQLRAVTFQGRDNTWGKTADNVIGEGRDSEASDAIIKVVDRPDPRPVWMCVWGGPADVAQAIWKVQQTRTPAELERFLGRLRIFLIGLENKPAQDGSGIWMLDTFPNLFVIVSQKTYGGMFAQNSPIGNLDWLNANVREGHGPLGAIYPPSGFNPKSPGMQEGDTPSFMYLYSAVRGINDPEKPDQESWGGQYVQRDPAKKHWYDGPGAESVSRWLPDMQSDFADRMDRCIAKGSIK
jgi:hypothetical protein